MFLFRIGVIVILIFSNIWLKAQDKLTNRYESINNAQLETFILDLEDAVYLKDKTFIEQHLVENIKNDFGGDGGIKEFKDYWGLNNESSPFWALLSHLLSLGGGKYENQSYYALPYVFSMWPGHEKYNAFEYMAITGTNVNVREYSRLEDSKSLRKLNYDIVKVDYDKSVAHPKNSKLKYLSEKMWYYIETLDGTTKGFVHWKYIWSPVGYRLGLQRIEGKWYIGYLLAGD